jgi:hypothetical protein
MEYDFYLHISIFWEGGYGFESLLQCRRNKIAAALGRHGVGIVAKGF